MIQDLTRTLTVQHLPKEQHALLRKFYRKHNSPMRITQAAQTWVVRSPHIIAGVCLSPVEHGFWLTSLLTDPLHRKQGMARLLIEHIQTTHQGSLIWLFCHPNLYSFYARLCFTQAQHLPQALSSRLQRYQQSKSLIAMYYSQQPTI